MDLTKMSNHSFSAITKIVIFFFIVFGSVACKSTESVSTNQSPSTQTVSTESAGLSESEMEELFWARQDSARMNFTEDDVKFMTGMIVHHSQALIMSDLAPKNGASPQVQTLAARITNAQKDEIKLMQNWLRDRALPFPEIHIDGLKMMIHGLGEDHMHMDHTNMVGMLSPQQLQELSEAKGKEFDRLFLKYMIEHHKGAVYMVNELFNTDGATRDEAAFRLASDIQVDQRTEIARMQLMLDNMTASN